MDPLSDVLRAVRMSGAYFYLVEAGTPWSVTTRAARELAPRIMPEAEHLISYHVLISGTCWGGLAPDSQVKLDPGDVILFPHGDAHLMSSDEGYRSDAPPLSETPQRYPDTVLLGPSNNRDTKFVCGFLGCDVRPFNPLLASLPRRMHIPGLAQGWLSHFPRKAVDESRVPRIGRDTLLMRMAELMFIEVMRQHLEEVQAAPASSGWIAALRDQIVGPALTHLHERPAHPWTLAELAQSIATSRTVLAERFSELVGVPPMLYLTRWRLQLAAEQLQRTTTKVATVGERVGYDSEAAFSRAFKRETGMSPAAWRQARQHASG